MPSSRHPPAPISDTLSTLGRAAHLFSPRRRRKRHAAAPPPPLPPARLVTSVLTVLRQLDSDGLCVRRASDAIPPAAFSPFLQLAHVGPKRVAVAAGSETPRRGQQCLSYVLLGELQYRDSRGCTARLLPGHAHLLTAGSGLVVSHQFRGPVVEYLSVWINLPRDLKAAAPRHCTAPARAAPCATIGAGDAAARIRVLAGPPPALPPPRPARPHSLELHTHAGRAAVYDIRMHRRSQLVLNPETRRVFVYVYRGAAVIGKAATVREGDLAVLEENPDLPLVIRAAPADGPRKTAGPVPDFDVFEHGCWCLVLAGDPISEPVAMLSSGIVACTPQEIRKAFQEYTCGSMGTASPPNGTHMPLSSSSGVDDDDSEHASDTGHSASDEGDAAPDLETSGSDDDIPDVGFGHLEV